jgi:hypothetical protein
MIIVARPEGGRHDLKLLDPWLWQYVRTQLAEGCSPEQIAGRLQREYPDDLRKHLSVATIYYYGPIRVAPRSPAQQTVGGAPSGAQGTPTSGAGSRPTGARSPI